MMDKFYCYIIDVIINTKLITGQTAFFVATANNHMEVCKVLASHGANVNTPDNQGIDVNITMIYQIIIHILLTRNIQSYQL